MFKSLWLEDCLLSEFSHLKYEILFAIF